MVGQLGRMLARPAPGNRQRTRDRTAGLATASRGTV